MPACGKCQGPLTAYWTRAGIRGRRRMVVCRRCYNEQRRLSYRAHHLPRTPGTGRGRRLVERLSDWYVRVLLSGRTRIPVAAWPAEIVELKRARTLLKRNLWQMTNAKMASR